MIGSYSDYTSRDLWNWFSLLASVFQTFIVIPIINGKLTPVKIEPEFNGGGVIFVPVLPT